MGYAQNRKAVTNMTREDAIEYLKSVREFYAMMEKFADTKDEAKFGEALDMAIEALSEKHQLSEDTPTNTPTATALPTAERRQGRWIKYMMNGRFDHYMCDRCKGKQNEKTNFCPKCGAAMDAEG